MEQARCAADAMAGVAAVKIRRLQRLSGLQQVAKIKTIEASGYTHMPQRVLFDCDFPGSAPAEGAKPYVSMLLVVITAVIDREPRIVLRAGRAAAALKNGFAGPHGLLLDVPFRTPSSGEIPQSVIGSMGKVPGGGKRLLDREGCVRTVFNLSRAPQDAGFGIYFVAQSDVDPERNVLHHNRQIIAGYLIRDVLERKVAIAAWERDLEIRLHI